jgi:hypothetical protein
LQTAFAGRGVDYLGRASRMSAETDMLPVLRYAAAVNRLLKAVFARVTPPLHHRHIRNRIITIVTFTFITRGGKHEVEKKQYDENTTEY